MYKGIFKIESNDLIADRTWRLELLAKDSSLLVGGEFVNLSIEGFYLRRPISICDRKKGAITLIYKTVGEGTKRLSAMKAGEELDVLTELGRGFDPDACREEALLVGGGLGAAPLYLLCKELKGQGKKVNVILGFNTAAEIVLTDEFARIADSVTVVTVDGSAGLKGFVTDAIKATGPKFDYFYTCGPMVMMKIVCNTLQTGGEASLEERMGCGGGYCYGCTIMTNTGPKRVCKDGPVFKKEDIIW